MPEKLKTLAGAPCDLSSQDRSIRAGFSISGAALLGGAVGALFSSTAGAIIGAIVGLLLGVGVAVISARSDREEQGK